MPVITSQPYDLPLYTYYYGLEEGQTGIFNSLKNGNYGPLKTYLKHGHDITVPVHWEYAIPFESPNIQIGNSMTAIFSGEATLLHAVVSIGGAEAIDILAEYNVDFNQYGYFKGSINGFTPADGTPLHMASVFNDTPWDVAQHLLDNGALPNILNSSNEAALDVSHDSGNVPFIAAFEQYLANHDMSNLPSISYEEYRASQGLDDLQENMVQNDHPNEAANQGFFAWLKSVFVGEAAESDNNTTTVVDNPEPVVEVVDTTTTSEIDDVVPLIPQEVSDWG